MSRRPGGKRLEEGMRPGAPAPPRTRDGAPDRIRARPPERRARSCGPRGRRRPRPRAAAAHRSVRGRSGDRWLRSIRPAKVRDAGHRQRPHRPIHDRSGGPLRTRRRGSACRPAARQRAPARSRSAGRAHGVAQAHPHDHPDVEQPVSNRRVGEADGKQQEDAAMKTSGRRSVIGVASPEGGGTWEAPTAQAGEDDRHSARQQQPQPSPLVEVLQPDEFAVSATTLARP